MIVKRFSQVVILLSLSGVIGMSAMPLTALADSPSEVAARRKDTAQQEQDSTVRQGLPGRRIGGGTRTDGIFAQEGKFLSALTSPNALTITTADHLELLFYVPEMNTDNNAEFVLLNAAGEVVYEKTFVAGRKSGLISISTADAEEMPSMNIEEDYEWYFSIIPDAEDRANDVVVHGAVRRVDAEEWLSQQQIDVQRMAMADPLVQAQILYKEAALWHDAALVLNDLRQESPEDEAIASEWKQLLDAAELSGITNSP